MQVLLVLINKGRLCIYFCSLAHRLSPGDQDVAFCRLRGKLMQVLPSETCSRRLGLKLFLFTLSP